MGHISELPDEIILNILEYLRNLSLSGLPSVMLSSRALSRVAASVLYTRTNLQVKLRNDTSASRFLQQLQPDNAHLVQSFNVEFSQVFFLGLQLASSESSQRLNDLYGVLPQLKQLRNFSSSLEKPSDRGFPIPALVIRTILNRLPQTVVNVDLDCESLYYPSPGQTHLCEVLGTLMVRLRCLRLRLPHVCDDVFASITASEGSQHAFSALEYAVFRLDTPRNPQDSRTCNCLTGEPVRAALLAEKLRALREQGKFPCLRRFAVIEQLEAAYSPQHDHWNVFKTRELTKGSMMTTTYPWRPRGGSSLLYMIRDSEGDWFGTFDEISKALEGPLATSTRRDEAQKRKNELSPNSMILDHSSLSSRQAATRAFGVSFRLWKHEELVGAKLLNVRIATGFGDTAGISEEVPPSWVWVRGSPWGWTIKPISQ